MSTSRMQDTQNTRNIPKTVKVEEKESPAVEAPKVGTMCNQCQKEFKSTKEVQDHIEAVHAPERRG